MGSKGNQRAYNMLTGKIIQATSIMKSKALPWDLDSINVEMTLSGHVYFFNHLKIHLALNLNIYIFIYIDTHICTYIYLLFY